MFGNWVDEASGFMKFAVRHFNSTGDRGRTLSRLRLAGVRVLTDCFRAALLLLAFSVLGLMAPHAAEAQEAGNWRAVQVTGVVFVRPADGTVDDWRQLSAQETLL